MSKSKKHSKIARKIRNILIGITSHVIDFSHRSWNAFSFTVMMAHEMGHTLQTMVTPSAKLRTAPLIVSAGSFGSFGLVQYSKSNERELTVTDHKRIVLAGPLAGLTTVGVLFVTKMATSAVLGSLLLYELWSITLGHDGKSFRRRF